MDYCYKYIKYRTKYINLKNKLIVNQHGGMKVGDIVKSVNGTFFVNQDSGRIVFRIERIDAVNITISQYHIYDQKPAFTMTMGYNVTNSPANDQITFKFSEPAYPNYEYAFVLRASRTSNKLITLKTRTNKVSGKTIESRLYRMSRGAVNIPLTIFPANSGRAGAAFIFLLVKSGYGKLSFIQVKNTRTHKWMLPGGQIDVVGGKKENPFTGMKREFMEEVGDDLPALDHETHVDMSSHKTRAYIGFTQQTVVYKKKYRIKHNETNEMKLFPLADLIAGTLDKTTIRWPGTLEFLLPFIIKFINENNIK
jgi:hypothetical protein